MAWATTVRQDAVTRLIAAATDAGSRVFDSRTHGVVVVSESGVVTVDTTPLLVVETGEIRRKATGHSKATRSETVQLSITGYVYSPESVDDADLSEALDDLEEQTHDALWDDGAWLALYKLGSGDGGGIDYLPCQRSLGTDENGVRLGQFRQTYEITQKRTRQAPSPDTRDVLETVTAAVKIGDETVANVTLADLEA